MDAILAAPAVQTSMGPVYELVAQAVGDDPVVRKRLELGRSMAAPSSRKDSVEVDCVARAVLSITDDSRNGALPSLFARPIHLLDQVEQFG